MGSLFQLRDYWYTSFPGEEFSPSALTLADPDVGMLFDKVVIGSFQGMLRILSPSANQGPMLPGDVLFEKKYDEPILQLECGPFRRLSAKGAPNILAILFPRKLLFLEVVASGSDTAAALDPTDLEEEKTADHPLAMRNAEARPSPHDGGAAREQDAFSSLKELGAFYTLKTQKKIELQRTAYNFASGCYGRSDHKMVCVQAMDGFLTFADSNGILYRSLFPPNQFLLPGPLRYCEKKDTLLTCNSSMFLMCYTYSSIIKNAYTDDGRGMAGLERSDEAPTSSLAPLWAFNLGEDAVDVAICRLTRGLPREEVNIVVLCTQTLYVLNDSGQPNTIHRLDFAAASLCVYPLPVIDLDNLLVGTFNGLVRVYSDTELQWSAAVPSKAAPLALAVATLCGVEGMILNLASDNTLTINYLGTDPTEQRAPSTETKSVSYGDMVTALKETENLIQQFTGPTAQDEDDDNDPFFAASGLTSSSAAASREKGSPAGEGDNAAKQPSHSNAGATLHPITSTAVSITSQFGRVTVVENTVSLTVTLKALTGGIDDVSLVAQATAPLLVHPAQQLLPHIDAGSSATASFTVGVVQDLDSIIPSSLDVVVVALFRGKRRVYETSEHTALAPLALVARPVTPIKNTAFSLQLNTDISSPPSLLNLFTDMVSLGSVLANVMSLHYLNGADASILISKNAARFKIQGSTFEGLWLLTAELTRRLRLYHGPATVKFDVPDGAPLSDFLTAVDTHWTIRREMAVAQEGLDNAAAFFRAVQKRLLVRFRDRSPADLTSMGILFEDCYRILQEKADTVTRCRRCLRQASAVLNCCANLFGLCLLLKYPGMAPEDETTLKALFRCSVTDSNEMGWEETTEAMLAKIVDPKKMKMTSKALELPSSTVNLKKYIGLLLSALQNGKPLLKHP